VLTGIDHIVIVTRDLDAAVAGYRELGFTVVPGGRHSVGTHNALIALADGAYLELIAFLDPDTPQPHRWWQPLQAGGGLVDFCAATTDFAGDAAALRRAGVEIDEPRPMSRTRPDGYVLRWTLASPREPHRGLVPFLIADDTPRRERVPAETAHANGVTALGAITIAVTDLAGVSRWYAALLGQAGTPGRRDDLGARTHRFTIGGHVVELAMPDRADSPLTGPLVQRGPGPYAATFRTARGVRRPLDEGASQGARLWVE
jgi:catechol 2,3-dioxygenase-like lactoylglutathione lyase family enzyme